LYGKFTHKQPVQTIPEECVSQHAPTQQTATQPRTDVSPVISLISDGFAGITKMFQQYMSFTDKQMCSVQDKTAHLEKQNQILEKRTRDLGSSKGASTRSKGEQPARTDNDPSDSSESEDDDPGGRHKDPYWDDPRKVYFVVCNFNFMFFKPLIVPIPI
jgi:hypothetical protein